MIKVATLNLAGAKQAKEIGVFEWAAKADLDFFCVQQTQLLEYQLEAPEYELPGMTGYFFSTEKFDFGGVGIYCRQQPKAIIRGMGFGAADSEGLFIQADYDQYSVTCVALPPGRSQEEIQHKQDLLQSISAYLDKVRKKRRDYIVCGDFQVAHREEDTADWAASNSDFGGAAQERAWFDELLGPMEYADALRLHTGSQVYTHVTQSPDQDGPSRRTNYQIVTPKLGFLIEEVAVSADECFGAQRPLVAQYTLD